MLQFVRIPGYWAVTLFAATTWSTNAFSQPAPTPGSEPAPPVAGDTADNSPVAPPPPAAEGAAESAATEPAPAAEPVPTDPTPAAEASGDVQLGTTLEPPPLEPIRLAPPKVDQEPETIPQASWRDHLQVDAFVDAYASLNYALPKPQTGRNRFRAFDSSNGFSISWVGLDFSYQREHFGGTLDLRFGPTAARLAGEAETSAGLHMVGQAFATWRVSDMVTLDFGKFNTIYGVEVAESQLNFNYTRGLLKWLGQPFFHTGLRATLDVSDYFWLTGLAVNGWNNSVDNNFGKSFGVQLSTALPNAINRHAPPLFDAHLGYFFGPEQVDHGVFQNFCDDPLETLNPRLPGCDSSVPGASPDRPMDGADANTVGLRHLIDLVVGVNPSSDVALVLNFNYGFENKRLGDLVLTYDDVRNDEVVLPGFNGESWWGLAAMGRVQFHPLWAGALRGEVFSDPNGRASIGDDLYVFGQPDVMLYSGTLTAEVVPHDGFILRLDNRLDVSNEQLFPAQVRSYSTTQFTTTLGVVVTTN